MGLSDALPITSIDTVSEFTRRSATGNCQWRTMYIVQCTMYKHRLRPTHPYRHAWKQILTSQLSYYHSYCTTTAIVLPQLL